jgi:hypothetical protein
MKNSHHLLDNSNDNCAESVELNVNDDYMRDSSFDEFFDYVDKHEPM